MLGTAYCYTIISYSEFSVVSAPILIVSALTLEALAGRLSFLGSNGQKGVHRRRQRDTSGPAYFRPTPEDITTAGNVAEGITGGEMREGWWNEVLWAEQEIMDEGGRVERLVKSEDHLLDSKHIRNTRRSGGRELGS